MSVVVDLIIVAVLAICIFLGYTRGLVKVATRILGFFIAIIISLVLFIPVSNFIINHTSIEKNLESKVSETVKSYVINEENENANVIIEEDANSKIVSKYINNFIEKEKQNIKEEESKIIDNVSENVSVKIIKIAVAIIIFIIVKILLIFINIFADIIEKLPIIGKFNKIGGLLYGLLQALIIIYIGLAIISLISPTIKNSNLIEAINNSTIGKFFYDNNLILQILF